MQQLTGNKIFVLYPDEELRENIFYGSLRNQFAIYYMYDYEKVRALVEYYPRSIIVINLIKNDLHWLPEELDDSMKDMAEDKKPKTIVLYDTEQSSCFSCSMAVRYNGNVEDFRSVLSDIFIDLGGKGRRNFVRYGGNGENVARLQLETEDGNFLGIAHDISASGLSCSLTSSVELKTMKPITVNLSLGDKTVILQATKILEREFEGNKVHILKFEEDRNSVKMEALLKFIYKSLDSEMEEFIKKLSN